MKSTLLYVLLLLFFRKNYVKSTHFYSFAGTQTLQKQEARNLKKLNEPERQAKQKLREASRVQLVDPNQASDDVLEFPEIVDKDDFEYYVPEIKSEQY